VGNLLTDLQAKQATYAAALDALLSFTRSAALLAALVARRQADAAAASQVQPAREIAAIRGTW
jgi:hypothetical protein